MTKRSGPSGPVRVLIAGAGLMGRWHGEAVRHAGGRVVAVFDRDGAAAQRLAARSGATPGGNLRELLTGSSPDVVHVCTPLDSHFTIIESALTHGAHVIAEKPLAGLADETGVLLELAAARGLLLCPVHQLIFQRWWPEVAAISPVLDVADSTCSAGAEGRSAADTDRVVAEILPHPLAVFERVVPGSLAAARWAVSHPKAGELRAQAAAPGTSLSLAISMSGRPTRQELRLTGAHGALHVDLFHGFAWREGAHVSRAYKIARPFAVSIGQLAGASLNLARRALAREPAYPGLVALVRAVFKEIEGVGPAAFAPDHAIQVARARDAILSAW